MIQNFFAICLLCAAFNMLPVYASHFLSNWTTSASPENVTLTFRQNVSITIYWGDGTNDSFVGTNITKMYDTAGQHVISITDGVVSGFVCDSNTAVQLVDISTWGDPFVVDENSADLFAGCTNIQVSAPDQPTFLPNATLQGMFKNTNFNSPLAWNLTNVVSLAGMFEAATSFNQPLNFTNTQDLVDTSRMFFGASLFDQPVDLVTTNVLDMSSMFALATSFNQPILFAAGSALSLARMFQGATSFNQAVTMTTASAMNISQMFFGATAFNSPVTLNTSQVQDMSGMFKGASSFNSTLNFTSTASVGNMAEMFADASSFNQPLDFVTSNVTNMAQMFFSASSFDHDVPFSTDLVTDFSYMFASTAMFNRAVNFSAQSAQTMQGMFANAVSFNSPLVLSNSNLVTDCSHMFENAVAFDQPVNLQTDAVQDMSNMFASASSFNQNVNFNSGNVTNMARMFQSAVNFNGSLTLDTHSVTNMAQMFFSASSFDHNVPFTTDLVTDFSYMFAFAAMFNRAVNFSAQNARTMQAMFRSAVSFNSPLVLSNSNLVTDCSHMFEGAVAFDQLVTLQTDAVQDMSNMFLFARNFNHPVMFNDLSNVQNMQSMFQGASFFNQTLNFNSGNVTNMGGMFKDAVNFNGALVFDTRNVLNMSHMFEGAARFNQPVVFEAANVQFTTNMLRGATSFNQPVTLRSSSRLMSTTGMFEEASAFNFPVVLTTDAVRTMDRMFANATHFNQSLSFSSTSNVTTMTAMFLGSNFEQQLASWNTGAVVSCDNFCELCGLPRFSSCSPCPGQRYTSPKRGSVCNCPAGEIQNASSTQCEVEICKLAIVDSGLNVQCVPPTPTPTGILVLSPLLNITRNDTNETTFVFTLPIDPQAYNQIGTLTQACYGQQISCEWQDPNSLAFQRSGCAVSKQNVDMGSGIVGTECTCTHLTVFAIIMRSELQLAPLCQAKDVDYVLIGLYGFLVLPITYQLARLARLRITGVSVVQHSLLLLACVLRVLYLIAKPIIDSLAILVLVGLLPSSISLSLFIHVLLTWASLQLFAFQASPFDKFRKPFIIVTSCVYLLTLVIVIALGASEGNASVQTEAVIIGSYILAAMYALVCVLVLAAGLGMARTLKDDSPGAKLTWRGLFRVRVLLTTIGIGVSLFINACLWVAAIQTDIIDSVAFTLATTASFYVFDWLSLCLIAWLFSAAVASAVRRPTRLHKSSSAPQISESGSV